MYMVSGKKIEALRGQLMVVKGREVSWKEFAKVCGITVQTIGAIRHRRHHGSVHTARKIALALRGQGIEIDTEDLLVPFTVKEPA